METDWENLTDPILLAVFSFLDKHELNSICRTCKNWYRIAQDESLWKRLIFRNFGCRYSRHDESWKSELKRLTYHVPKRLHQTCLGHVDEIYYVCFSNSGKLIATCGADGSVKVWQYGNNTELLQSRQVLDRPSYANYVEFNEAETQVLVNCIVRVDEDMQAILAVLSIEKGLAIVAARNSWFPNFRGTWLHNDTFLIADVLAFFFSNDNVKLVACTFYDDLDDSVLLERPLGEHLADDNVELRPIVEMERDEYRPHFVKVIDWSKWNQDNSIEHDPNSSLNEKVIIIFQQSLEWDIVHRLVFYKLDVDCEVPSVAEPMKIIVINSGCMGVQLSADHRDIVYNFRRIYVAGDNSYYEKDVHTMVINLASTGEKPEIFTENKALEESTLFYLFPSISSDFIASGSEQDVAFLWDRHSKLVIAQLPHKLSDPNAQNGVSGVAFHPHDQEVLVSVADDCKVRIWMSANRENHLQ
ncbi:F-box/WD repeat-containing protein 5-like [Ostrea edulis]|uniref:F-box/WD repeat-containing protein 5-like n=1 Tax=Ostrea edulis TaxID=37623 RepID=UPI0024AF50D2|nr:F-box/WD repeat-containing protein 5-like [Ostrea edulis]